MSDAELQVAEKQEVKPAEGELTHEGIYFTPAVDILENPKELVVMVDMPGVGKDSVEIDLKDNILSIVGRVIEEAVEGEELLTEYRTGSYFRTFRITDVVDQSKITASMADGVLKLTLPKAEKAVPRKIAIASD